MNRVCVVYHGLADVYGHWPFEILLFIKIMGNSKQSTLTELFNVRNSSRSQNEILLIGGGHQPLVTLNMLFKNLEHVDEMFECEGGIRFPNVPKNRPLFQNFVKKINNRLKRNG